ncbi:MAG: endonuclease III [Legionellales bacterium]|nr:endonuclease III [Legionellales bacterium]
MKKADIDTFFSILKQHNEAPKTELMFINHYQLLTSVILSAQATDISVNKATKPLFELIKTPEDMVQLGEDALITYIKSIGLYRAKAKHIIQMSKQLIHHFNSEVPSTLSELQSLPGVGRKTANVVLNEAFGIPTIAVDTHVFRVSNRVGLAKGKTPDQVELKLMKVVPKHYQLYAHHWLILHGRYICTARSPRCTDCPVFDLCGFKNKSN